MSPDTQSLYSKAVWLHQAGKRAEAEQLFRQVLVLNPFHAGSLHLLGVMQYLRGNSEAAIVLIGQAIAVDAAVADHHSNLGLALNALGRRDEAAASLSRALQLKPDRAEIWNNLGAVFSDQDRPDAAADCYRKALALQPDIAAIHVNLARALQHGGKLTAAIVSYRKALALDEGDAGAHQDLGDALRQQGRLEDAADEYWRALAIRPDDSGPLNSLASLAQATGDPGWTLLLIRRSLNMKEDVRSRRIFAELMQEFPPTQCDDEVWALMVRAIEEAWDWPVKLAKTAAILVLAAKSQSTDMALLADDPLLHALLVSAPNCDLELEAVLTGMRRRMLDEGTEAEGLSLSLRFRTALARQCFINEYVWPVDAEEAARAEAFRESLIAALDAGTVISVSLVAAVASYFPLRRLPDPMRLLGRSWPGELEAVLTQQLREPQKELHLQETMPRLTGIVDPISLRVRAQYEGNPYPRWIRIGPGEAGQAAVDRDILVAGCGTGQYLFELAGQSPGARILAVDLSLASLGYAQRKADEAGLTGISFGQADILELGALGRTFDLIECSGVLHHLADPFEGWRSLLALLRPGGKMRLGLYSELGRRNISLARQSLEPTQGAVSADDIRRRRQELVNAADSGFSDVMTSADFYSVSGCRDLLFHVNEQRVTLERIGAFLRDNSLTFLGFSAKDAVLAHYRKCFPDDPDTTNLDHWQVFEQGNPGTFTNMYQFWIRREE